MWICHSHKDLRLTTTAYTYNRPRASCPRNLWFYEIFDRSVDVVESGLECDVDQTFIIRITRRITSR